jgi:hypothetical protein
MIKGVSAYQRTYATFVREVGPVSKIQRLNQKDNVETLSKEPFTQDLENALKNGIKRGNIIDIIT